MFKKHLIVVFLTLCSIMTYAQVEIKGLVYDEYLEPFYNASIQLNGKTTTSNEDGEFRLNLTGELPVTLKVMAFGYKTEELIITSLKKSINVILKESELLDQIVMSASRVPERIIESPVTIERFGSNDIKNTSSISFYDGLSNVKGVQLRESSYGFKSVNTRGFSDFSNSRFVQMVDGMDMAAPGLNFSPGNLTGVSDLDIHSVEILPGASSALYGANAYNGMMLMTTKNPFEFEGISVLLKNGYTSQKLAGNNNVNDASIRMAYKFSESFAAKVNFSYFEAEEWQTNDLSNKRIDSNEIVDGNRDDLALVQSEGDDAGVFYNNVIDYDGLNIYGDEFDNGINLRDIAFDFWNFDIRKNILISRTGYSEQELLRDDYKNKNIKFNASFHYRPFKNKSLELIFSSRHNTIDNIIQGTTRLVQRDYKVAQNKFEIKGDNFFVRAYHVKNNAGNSYDLNSTGSILTERSRTNNNNDFNNWGVDYLEHLFGIDPTGRLLNLTSENFASAREYADSFMTLRPGNVEFNKELKDIKNTLNTKGGSRIYDRSYYQNIDGNYNFTSLLNNWGDVQIGGSFREYNPNSKGTIFNDSKQEIKVNEYGLYTQIQKKFLEEKLRVTGSIRYDKSQNFEGNYSPRIALNYALGEEKNHFLRASYQTGFRNPTIQEQYVFNGIGNEFLFGRKIILGTSQDNLDRVSFGDENDALFNILTGVQYDDVVISGDDIINNSLLTETLFTDTGYVGDAIKSVYKGITPEKVQTFELGYRSMFSVTGTSNVNIDVNGFYSKHKDFVFRQNIITPRYGLVYPNGNTSVTDAEKDANPFAIYSDNGDGNVVVYDLDARIAIQEGDYQEFSITTNSNSEVTSYGFGIGLNTKFLKSFDFGVNYNFIDFEVVDKDLGFFEPNFNTPKHTVKVALGNEKVFRNFGFNVNARWQDKYRWVSQFVKGDVSARAVLDAQLNYHIPSMKSKFKIGGTNLFGKEYVVAPGSGQIGQLYYVSWIINN